MDNRLKFSIGIPAFKAEHLRDCIESILNQDYTNFELIIVNDFSPQPIEKIVLSYNDERIKYYKNDFNIGAENVVTNWNRCLEKSTSDYFVLMGDDDILEKNYLSEFDKLIRSFPNLNVYHCRSLIIDEKSLGIELTPSNPQFESVLNNIWHRITEKRIQFLSDFVYKTSFLKLNGGFYFLPLAWASDDITSYLAASINGIAHTEKVLFRYRRHSNNISSTGKVDLKLKAISMECDWILDFVSKKDFTNNEDMILKKNILATLPKYKKKKILYTLSESLSGNFLKGVFRLGVSYKIYKISLVEFLFICFNYLKSYQLKKGLKL
ncbi:glycosyltransferase family 2 protein [Arcicella lustrica]|uniref:Glycosyltransferase family 2 protein n=1 Tax=Arcicella lustrica TaxID=2984196 RepID=A0ABU5SMR3_9BACT|nr:glycosyltransferase family 2 protein [Arcicella sp. DC25W]MEA5428591.1 glycosyltransferase family 2 protein [Arcicella sp. DC25W]